MTGWPWELVTFDIDGTLTVGHGWRYLAERTGQVAAYERSNQRFARLEAGEDEHLRDLLNLAAGRTVDEVYAILASTPKVAGIEETVRTLRARGSRVALLTHNPEYICDWYRREYGFDDFEGTEATRLVDGRIAPYPAVRAAKVAGLDRLLGRLGARPRATVHVGDGRADTEVFRRVGGGVALNAALPEVRAAADLALDLRDLRDLVRPLAGLTPRPD
jgi:HAD superfamily phosphoserine phosphatase-like hydrolase